jgi:AraC family transcriptional regulator
MEVEFTTEPARRLGAVRHVGPYNQIGRAFAQLGHTLGPWMPELAERGAMMALYHDDPRQVPPEALRADAAMVVPDDFVLPEGLVELRLPAGRYASTVHVGPYEHLGAVWQRFMGEWLPASGHTAAASPTLETYLNNPETTLKAEWRTRLSIPLV